jgi:hypothetical protein
MTDLSEPAPIASTSTPKVGGLSFGRSALAATVGTTIEWYDFQASPEESVGVSLTIRDRV